MTKENGIGPDACKAIAFVGDALAPFFLEDPELGTAAASFEAFSQLDIDAAALEWPFGDREPVGRALGQMVSGLAAGIVDELVWEYRRLFVGPGHKAAAPWGSVYTDHDGVIFGKSTLELRDWMRRNGVARLADHGDPDDHIGLLLALMAWLARNRPELLRDFLGQHVLCWSSHYLSKLHGESTHSFYRGLAVLTRESLVAIGRELDVEPAARRLYR